MKAEFPGFVGPSYQSRSWKAANQRCCNWYPEQDPEKGLVLYATPGTAALATAGTEVYALEATPSNLVVVSDAGVTTYSDVVAGQAVGAISRGSMSLSTFAIVAQAGTQVMIVNGQNGYAFDRSNDAAVLTEITDPDFPINPQSCAALDGFFLTHGVNDDRFFWSDPFDPLTWNALDFASAENLNDKLQRIVTVQREAYMLGALSTEIWANVGGDEVFDRVSGTYIPYGTQAPQSAAVIGQSLLWLAQDQNGQGLVMRARGLSASRVSTHAIEEELLTYPTLADAYGLTYQQGGHEFYCLSFPSAGKTWVYDLTTNFWHERQSTVPDPAGIGLAAPVQIQQAHWRARCHAFFAGLNVIGTRNLGTGVGQIEQLSAAYGTEAGAEIIRTRTSPHVFAANDYTSLHEVVFMLQPGVGIEGSTAAGGSGVDPQAMLRISKDGGRSWGYQRRTTMGRQGKYRTLVDFKRCGRARDLLAELSISAPVPIALAGAYFDVSQ